MPDVTWATSASQPDGLTTWCLDGHHAGTGDRRADRSAAGSRRHLMRALLDIGATAANLVMIEAT
jgi:hypothetical protein